MQIPKTAQKPCYIILFETAQSREEPYKLYLPTDEFNDSKKLITVPHGLAKELVPCMRALWFCLHLPATTNDLIDLQANQIRSQQQYSLAHDIVLLPSTYIAEADAIIKRRSPVAVPSLVFSADSLIQEADDLARRLSISAQTIAFSALNPKLIPDLWRRIHAALIPEQPYLERDLRFVNRLDLVPILLPNAFLLRQMGGKRLDEPANAEALENLTFSVINDHAVISAIARCENDGLNEEEASKVLESLIEHERQSVTFPVSIVALGVAPAYVKKAHAPGEVLPSHAGRIDQSLLWSDIDSFQDDGRVEKVAVNLLATHRAIARGGTAIVGPAVPPNLFHLLNNMERQYGESRSTKQRHVWKWLKEIGDAAADMFDEASTAVMGHASFVNVFSNFPLGLAILPGDTSPYCCRVPIAYRPILPLTPALQSELLNPQMIGWAQELSVLIVECIEESDPVGKVSRATWSHIKDLYASHPTIHVAYVEAESPSDVAAALAAHRSDALVISAHGHYNREGNAAGIMIGNQLSLGDDLGIMPPLVVLSACHVAPRGAGAVNIADLLLRQGALTVLGTLVPVNVKHNGILMNRLFLYLSEALSNGVSHRNLAEVWHHVATSNAVHDILFSSPGIEKWAWTKHQGKMVLELFTQERSVGRLRKGHIYNDTVTVLREIAVETNSASKFDSWLATPGYAPETLFYMLIGWPERILLKEP